MWIADLFQNLIKNIYTSWLLTCLNGSFFGLRNWGPWREVKKDQQTNSLSDFACITGDQFRIHKKKKSGEL